jgi:hypothetical protein
MPPVAPVVLLQVDRNPHQPGHRARIAAKTSPVPVRLQETLLGQRLGQIHIARGRQQEPEYLRPVRGDDSRKLLRGNLIARWPWSSFPMLCRLPSLV